MSRDTNPLGVSRLTVVFLLFTVGCTDRYL